MVFKKMAFVLPILFSTPLKADNNDGIAFNGVDLNPALLGCLVSGSACLDKIPLIGSFFDRDGPVPQWTRIDECRALRGNWCYGNGGSNSAQGYWVGGYMKCRRAKMAYYKSKQASWPKFSTHDEEYAYFLDIEADMLRCKRIDDYFTCTGKQRALYIEHMCSGIPNEFWESATEKERTIHCNG